MQLTIDSDKQPLTEVLRVISAMYNVEVVAQGSAAARSSASAASTSRSAKGATRRRQGAPSPADVRAWAVAHGHPVSARGRISRSVMVAYKAASAR